MRQIHHPPSKTKSMQTISIALQENNLAEVLAGVGILGIVKQSFPEHEFASHWENSLLKIDSAIPENLLTSAVLDFLHEVKWVQAAGDVHHGILKAKNIMGLDFLLSPSSQGEPSIFKNFSGQVTSEKIVSGLVSALPAHAMQQFSDLLFFTATDLTSWGLDWRTSGHSLDIGYSANDDGTSQYDPVFVAVELLGLSALSFFMTPWSLQTDQDYISYQLWRQAIPAKLAASAFTGLIPGLPSQTYRSSRRGKSYGKGASYRYFPPAISLQH
jgi:hypothetical protein